ncbi:hypothetical protein CJI97_005159 [Candidozyma auris]|uniref:hypothetical_protein n=1 Tax=Candidozyma auris TaxID=498019 RepID=UPI000C537D37|nr:hypothetical_protein [[Candida] auris]PIS48998.1 hypothetical protein CJI97_005159 [[Candida] auris]QEO22978.1 hypothetical_protein [[Candida] auris]GBL49025.1 hypothetical protein CAJCM15448_12990 [[Candida] auris]
MPEKERFPPGSQVLAYHGPLVYEAKVLKFREKGKLFVEIGEGQSEPLEQNKIPLFLQDGDAYFLHYKGWSPKWDEWVSNERVMELNDDNLGLSRELRNARKRAIDRLDPSKERKKQVKEESKEKRRRKSPSVAPSSTSSNGTFDSSRPSTNGSARKRIRQEPKTPYYEIMIPLRPQLKVLLVDDWEFMTRDHKLVDLETTTPVKRILEDFYDNEERRGVSEEMLRTVREAVDGLAVYFDKMLRFCLLYRFERLQYSQLLEENPNIDTADIYGMEHLLRLLVTLPAQVAQTNMNSIALNTLLAQMRQLSIFIDENAAKYASSYMNASPAYDRLARGA